MGGGLSMNIINIVIALIAISNISDAIFYHSNFPVLQNSTLILSVLTLTILGYVSFQKTARRT